MESSAPVNTPTKRSQDEMSGAEEASGGKTKVMRTCQKNCNECKRLAANNQGDEENFAMICQRCGDCYHSRCVGIQSSYIIGEIKKKSFRWSCFKCQMALLDSIDAYPSKMNEMNKSVQTFNQQFDDLRKLTASYEIAVRNLGTAVEAQKAEIVTLKNEMQTLKEEKAKVEDLIDLKEVVEQMRAELNELKTKTLSTAAPVDNLPQIQNQVNYLANQQRKDDLVIQGVPIITNEDKNNNILLGTVEKLAGGCGYQLKPEDVKKIYRMRQKENSDSPAPILVRFYSTTTAKEDFFLKYLEGIKATPLTRSCLGLEPPNKRIFINHHISQELMTMKKKALDLRRDKKIDRVVTRYNMIRIEKDSTWHSIFTAQQLDAFLLQHQSTFNSN